ncbi:hypothetical protein [Modestobacter sp. VKM Ac-2985]|uniref:hypothetical protein n=1 Tax=Modestobacter sp. VKM Ac-2985 TaxID=3004139 RepID=UPI0022AB7296|nr:hypothetical protein [Modestobacter sp. VKM Ac-2985]MCZ2837136.1 hypothetical protein [Modestobacter sp. VKM Ac-2985]
MTSTKNGTANKLSLLKGKKPREGTHSVVLDHEAVEEYAYARQLLTAAQDQLRLARRRSEPDVTLSELQAYVDEAQFRADELEPAADEGAGIVKLKIRAMAPLAYAALKAEFPPTDEDHKRVRDGADEKAKARWNQADFGPRIVAHCVVDPDVTLEDAQGFRETWTEPEWNLLVGACMDLHERAVDTASLVFSSGRTRG